MSQMKFKNDNTKKYKFEAICNSMVYSNKSEIYLLGFYYIVLLKNYLEEENTLKPTSAI